ncbi:exported protein [Candidatus Kuenenia stuttgartiensis]|jgi:hypothetical protein|uniref:Exported protein n=1 Tax=Kuenenia stuttgartiensis TaxID=174633 RepID=Q1Q6M9_KUEST|nr:MULTISPECIES: hypothetical protein [Kuenenia]MBW7942860.1 hypothetical protein [Candidatus Kuenenia stuttgartiensis]MBZ0192617.1 hypothetical protein [Candidatus Kuenenia stuttgartiensis]MCL4726643.1 hypothetical protein [Candidatus Kuenenia stuttgartiensis]MCZ7620889.1 hypothetical protein [Candidatus Kuenenia sp.]QII12962.1 exported protein [Candidatus Kuenenia stuttgartiensis]
MKRNVALLMITFFAFIALAGCATGQWGRRNLTNVSRYVNGDAASVWEAVDQALIGIRVKEKNVEKGLLITDWVSGYSTTQNMGVLLEGRWHERYRLFITVVPEQNKTYLSIGSQVEQKAPGGTRAYRWDRIPSNGLPEQMILDRVEQILSAMEQAP